MAKSGRSVASAARLVPEPAALARLREAAAACRACDLWKRGTQTVFGEGARDAEVFFVGEQPGNDEDLAGRPFVGPAGKVLDRALAAAGIDRRKAYVTNVLDSATFARWKLRSTRLAGVVGPREDKAA